MRSLVIFGLVALTRAFPNPQESDDDLLADIDGGVAERYNNVAEDVDLDFLASIFGTSNKPTYEIVQPEVDDTSAEPKCHDPDIPTEDHSPSITVDDEARNCLEYADQGFRCVPYYSCEDGEIIIDGAGLFNPRFGGPDDVAVNPENSKCEGALEMCCRHPDWYGIPITTPVKITKPPPSSLIPCPKEPECPNTQAGCPGYVPPCFFTQQGCSIEKYPQCPNTQDGCPGYCPSTQAGCPGYIPPCYNTQEGCTVQQYPQCPNTQDGCPGYCPSTQAGCPGYIPPCYYTQEGCTIQQYPQCPYTQEGCPGYCPSTQAGCPGYVPPCAYTNEGCSVEEYPECPNTQAGCAGYCPSTQEGCPGYIPPCFNTREGCSIEQYAKCPNTQEGCPGYCPSTQAGCPGYIPPCFSTQQGCSYQEYPQCPNTQDGCPGYCPTTQAGCPGYVPPCAYSQEGCSVEEYPECPNTKEGCAGYCPSTQEGCPGYVPPCAYTDVGCSAAVYPTCPNTKQGCPGYCPITQAGCPGYCPSTDPGCPGYVDPCQYGCEDKDPKLPSTGGGPDPPEPCNPTIPGCPGYQEPSPAPYTRQCGKRNVGGLGVRIQSNSVFDRETQFAEWPHMCAVLNVTEIGGTEQNLFVCGGSLIAPGVVLTAAHCVDKVTSGYGTSSLKVRCGEWDTQGDFEPLNHQDRLAEKVLIHPEYNKRNLANDVAVIVLKEEFVLSQHIGTMCLPSQDDYSNIQWEKCVATGWGKDEWGKAGSYQVIMKQIELDMVDPDTCQNKLRTTRLGEYFKLDESFSCAGGKAGEDACTGDGGGPLVCPVIKPQENFDDYDIIVEGRYSNPEYFDNAEQVIEAKAPEEKVTEQELDPTTTYIQTGIIAWGVECGMADIPGVYANVSKALCFIDYATKCVLGQDADHYGLTGCDDWAKTKYCDLKFEIEDLEALVESTNNLREKGKYARKVRNIKKQLPAYEDLINGCDSDYTERSNSIIDCYGDSGFDADALARISNPKEER